MWDNGSTLSFITFSLAERLKLKGKALNLSLEVVGSQKIEFESFEYCIDVLNKSGELVQMYMIGIEKISSDIESIDIDKVAKLLSVPEGSIDRPMHGEIELLIGVRYAGYHPCRISANGHLLLLENQFGFIVEGTHQLIHEGTKIDTRCMQMRHAIVMFISDSDRGKNAEFFHSIENLGVNCIPQCGSCRCGKCHPGGKDMTIKDEKEYKLIESKIKFKQDRKRWEASYPWIRNPEHLKPNHHIAIRILKSTEKRLLRNQEHTKLYSK